MNLFFKQATLIGRLFVIQQNGLSSSLIDAALGAESLSVPCHL